MLKIPFPPYTHFFARELLKGRANLMANVLKQWQAGLSETEGGIMDASWETFYFILIVIHIKNLIKHLRILCEKNTFTATSSLPGAQVL